MTSYEGSGGNVYYEFKGGLSGVSLREAGLTIFGDGTETGDLSAAADNLVNGVTQFKTAGAEDNSVGLAFPRSYRPGIKENGRLREANGSLVTKLRFGFPQKDDMFFFFGILDEAPGAARDVETILTSVAAGTITSVESDFAGFYFSSEFTNETDRWRCVAINSGGGNKAGSEAPVKTDREVDSHATYMNQSPTLSPTLSVEVTMDGTVEFYHNGDLVRRAKQGVDPEKTYCPLFVLQTNAAAIKTVAVDLFCAEYARYYGPIFP